MKASKLKNKIEERVEDVEAATYKLLESFDAMIDTLPEAASANIATAMAGLDVLKAIEDGSKPNLATSVLEIAKCQAAEGTAVRVARDVCVAFDKTLEEFTDTARKSAITNRKVLDNVKEFLKKEIEK